MGEQIMLNGRLDILLNSVHMITHSGAEKNVGAEGFEPSPVINSVNLPEALRAQRWWW